MSIPQPGPFQPAPSRKATVTDLPLGGARGARRLTAVYVYEVPVRLWHWINAFAIVVLCITGYLIASPLPTMQIGEAAHQFVMGYVRFTHFAAAMILIVGFAARAYWALVGNHHARQIFTLPLFNFQWWKEVWHEIRWYAFLERQPRKYAGHNPLAQLAMFTFITLGVLFMIVTGLALYGEGEGALSWIGRGFGWVIPLAGGSQMVHSLHHLGMWSIVIFTLVHIYVAVREDIMSRQSIISTMISGQRTFKDDRPD
ncbi:Ni/Fe-hydrogenase, b-type cytochrome subunit [Rubellimicrobium arenae]|uniref:Ni/Fe-hydrogenase, b-type cytochrome subunit n=1 Tax=Rubellimicrobium arenae TaxID=2817372 RepID=UPI001B3175D2|nr:Ni/Fe-hydrogenase, b-type cytochrome subunit [Rubellimicrobium arenae]